MLPRSARGVRQLDERTVKRRHEHLSVQYREAHLEDDALTVGQGNRLQGDVLAQRQPADIEKVLTSGVMMAMAEGLTPAEISAVAHYVGAGGSAPATPAH